MSDAGAYRCPRCGGATIYKGDGTWGNGLRLPAEYPFTMEDWCSDCAAIRVLTYFSNDEPPIVQLAPAGTAQQEIEAADRMLAIGEAIAKGALPSNFDGCTIASERL